MVKRATFLLSESAFSCLDWFQDGILKKPGNLNDFIRFFKFICVYECVESSKRINYSQLNVVKFKIFSLPFGYIYLFSPFIIGFNSVIEFRRIYIFVTLNVSFL